MKIIGRKKIESCYRKHCQAKQPLLAWQDDVMRAKWTCTHDIKNTYRSASFLKNNRVIFNIKGNDFRLVVRVKYEHDIVQIEWVGTHAEYDEKRF